MNDLNNSFNEYINAFKGLDTLQKRKEVINSIKEIIVFFQKLAIKDSIELEYLKNREIYDLKKDNISEDDFLEAEIVYLEVAKNIIGQYLDKKSI